MIDNSDGTDKYDLISSAVNTLDPVVVLLGMGPDFKTSKGLIERASVQSAMATLKPLGGSYSAALAIKNASIREALKSSIGMQSVTDFMRPIREMQTLLFPTGSLVRQLSAQAAVTQVGQLVKEIALAQPLLKSSALLNTKLIRERLMPEPLMGSSLARVELAALATVSSLKRTSTMAELVTIGASLLQDGRLGETEEINWDSPASNQLLSTIAVAAVTLKDAPEPAPDLAGLADASNDDDGGLVSSPQQLHSELAEAATTGDLSKLSPAAKAYFNWFCWLLTIIVGFIATQNAIREELCFLQPKLSPGLTAGKMGKAVRKALCETTLVIDGDYRFVKGTGVRLRDAPGIKAAILPVHLADGQIIEVLDNSNTDWLHVSVITEGIDGWVSRKYTRVLSVN